LPIACQRPQIPASYLFASTTFPAMRRDAQLTEGQTTLSTIQAVEEQFICMSLSLYQIGQPE
jgi:hypothetical protein